MTLLSARSASCPGNRAFLIVSWLTISAGSSPCWFRSPLGGWCLVQSLASSRTFDKTWVPYKRNWMPYRSAYSASVLYRSACPRNSCGFYAGFPWKARIFHDIHAAISQLTGHWFQPCLDINDQHKKHYNKIITTVCIRGCGGFFKSVGFELHPVYLE